MDVAAHLFALEGFSLQSDEFVGGAMCPRGEHQVIQGDAILKKKGRGGVWLMLLPCTH